MTDTALTQRMVAQLILATGYEHRDEPFTLVSGAQSHDYIDGKFCIAKGENLRTICQAAIDMVGEPFDAVGGLTMGADPLAHGISMLSGAQWFSVRKEPKGHGLKKWLEGGRLKTGDRVLLVDDVITTGGSTLTALDRINEQVPGVEIVAAVTLADRGDTASKAFADRGIRFVPLCTYRELGIDPVVPPQ